jgi:hypothetical protein
MDFLHRNNLIVPNYVLHPVEPKVLSLSVHHIEAHLAEIKHYLFAMDNLHTSFGWWVNNGAADANFFAILFLEIMVNQCFVILRKIV